MGRPDKDDPIYDLPRLATDHYVYNLEIYCDILESVIGDLREDYEKLHKMWVDSLIQLTEEKEKHNEQNERS